MSRLEEQSRERIKATAEFLSKYFKGNEEQNRFANGIPAEGEDYQSVMGTCLDAKNESDNAGQSDWARGTDDLEKSGIGQATMDICHSGAAGGYGLGNEITTSLDFASDSVNKNKYLFLPPPYFLFENTSNGMSYTRDITGYSGYKIKKYFRDKIKVHDDAKSEDNEKADLSNPGYLSVKGAGMFIHDLPRALFGAALASQVKGGTAAVLISAAEGGMNALTNRIDDEMDRLMAKPEQEMLLNPDYVQIRKKISDPEKRDTSWQRNMPEKEF